MEYKKLVKSEVSQFKKISRAEHITHMYRMRNGQLVLECDEFYTSGWSEDECNSMIKRLEEICDLNGDVIGVILEQRIVALLALDYSRYGSKSDHIKLDMLYVDHHHRGKGIGSFLVDLAKSQARKQGAESIYVSATPTKNTVDFYRRHGAEVLTYPDEKLFALEPDDIHMSLKVKS